MPMKCLLCRTPLSEDTTRSFPSSWVLWTNILVLPTISISFALALFESIGAWSLILGIAGTTLGVIALNCRTRRILAPTVHGMSRERD